MYKQVSCYFRNIPRVKICTNQRLQKLMLFYFCKECSKGCQYCFMLQQQLQQQQRRGGGGIVAHRKKMSSFGIIKSSFEACQRPIVADFSSFRNNIKCILLLFTYSGAAAAAAALPPLPRRHVQSLARMLSYSVCAQWEIFPQYSSSKTTHSKPS